MSNHVLPWWQACLMQRAVRVGACHRPALLWHHHHHHTWYCCCCCWHGDPRRRCSRRWRARGCLSKLMMMASRPRCRGWCCTAIAGRIRRGSTPVGLVAPRHGWCARGRASWPATWRGGGHTRTSKHIRKRGAAAAGARLWWCRQQAASTSTSTTATATARCQRRRRGRTHGAACLQGGHGSRAKGSRPPTQLLLLLLLSGKCSGRSWSTIRSIRPLQASPSHSHRPTCRPTSRERTTGPCPGHALALPPSWPSVAVITSPSSTAPACCACACACSCCGTWLAPVTAQDESAD